nr:MAG TPA: hypothetical protein [Caudoviricetes sp.]
MAFVPFYLPKRIWKLFFRSRAYFFEKILKTVRAFFAFIRKRYRSGCYFLANFVLRPEKCRSNPLRKLGGFCSLLYRKEV